MNDDHTGAVLEDIEDKITRVLEAIAPLAGVPAQLQAIEARLSKVENKTDLIYAVVKDHNRELKDHEARITSLEAA
jgi:hypothetical protein